jgi:hypothetical protein
MQAQMAAARKIDEDHPKRQRLASNEPLQTWLDEAASRAQGLFNAYYMQACPWRTRPEP